MKTWQIIEFECKQNANYYSNDTVKDMGIIQRKKTMLVKKPTTTLKSPELYSIRLSKNVYCYHLPVNTKYDMILWSVNVTNDYIKTFKPWISSILVKHCHFHWIMINVYDKSYYVNCCNLVKSVILNFSSTCSTS